MAAQHAGQPMQTVVEVRNVGKRYGIEGRKRDGSVTQALDHVSFAVAAGEFTGIMGPSGSGKSTLLNCLATIDAPTSGSIHIGGRDVGSLAGKELARFRREELGFIFQDSNLLDTLTAAKAPVFATVDHRANAQGAGLDMTGARVVIFGNPAVGTALMQAAPEAALNLPLKILVWESPDGVMLSWSDPAWIAGRYGADPNLEVVAKMRGMLEKLTSAAAGS